MRFLLGLCLLVSTASHAGVYETRFSKIARSGDLATCQVLISQFADNFAAVTGKQVIDYGCDDDRLLDRTDGVIVYVADAAIPRITTYTPTPYATAIYSSKGECVAALPLQEEIYEAATGLEPVASFCMADTFARAFTSRVDGFGKSAVSSRTMATRTQGTVSDLEIVVDDIKRATSARKITISEIGLASSGGLGTELVARGYAVNAYSFDDYSDLQFSKLSDCKVNEAKVNDVILANIRPVFTFCSYSGQSGASKLHVVSVKDLLSHNDVVSIRKLPRRYESTSSCQAFASNLADAANGILGGICAGEANGFYVHMFTTPTGR